MENQQKPIYTYAYTHMGYTVYKNGKPIHSARVLNTRKRWNKTDADDNKRSAEAHIKLLKALDRTEDMKQ